MMEVLKLVWELEKVENKLKSFDFAGEERMWNRSRLERLSS